MTREEALKEVEGCLTDYFPLHCYEEAEEIMKALKQEPCEDAVSRNDVIKMLNTMDRYSADKLRLCDTNKEFPSNEVFIVDDVYEELDLLPPVRQQEPILDKIRAEILNDWQIKKFPSSPFSCGLRYAVEIIDKYRGKSDCRECKAEHDCYECKKYAESERQV